MYMIVWIITIIDWNRFANQLRGVARNYFGVRTKCFYYYISQCQFACEYVASAASRIQQLWVGGGGGGVGAVSPP